MSLGGETLLGIAAMGEKCRNDSLICVARCDVAVLGVRIGRYFADQVVAVTRSNLEPNKPHVDKQYFTSRGRSCTAHTDKRDPCVWVVLVSVVMQVPELAALKISQNEQTYIVAI
jgi:hypothetical protein